MAKYLTFNIVLLEALGTTKEIQCAMILGLLTLTQRSRVRWPVERRDPCSRPRLAMTIGEVL